ncbi:MAG: hypothetical protein JWQ30_2881 [Sediminibacterium sp.]|nr:hypothetical protein [Sediminibacterium sp.]
MAQHKKNRKDRIIRYAFIIAIGIIVASVFLLNRDTKLEILGALFVASAGWLEVVKIPMKEKNPLLEEQSAQ